jgi:HSP20 family protein
MKNEGKEIVKSDIAQPMSSIFDLARWFDDFPRRSLFSSLSTPSLMAADVIVPAVDIYEDGNDYVLKAELPGLKKEDIDITMTEDSITVSGEKSSKEEIKRKDYCLWERSYGSFSRSFALPGEVQTGKVTSKYMDGILEIRMPKSEEAKKKEIKLQIQ